MAYGTGIQCPFSRQKQETTMPQPPQDVDTLFEDLWHDLPPETVERSREFRAFTRARQINTPVPWLRLVLLSGGLDKSLRDVAGNDTLLVEAITDSSVAARLAACRPWVRALLAQMVPCPTTLSAQRRFLVIDGSGIQAPGARGTQYRLHLGRELVTLTVVSLTITDQRTGKSLRHFPLEPGDVALADRGSCPPEAIRHTVPRGAEVLLRLNPHNVPLVQRDGTPVDWVTVWRQQAPATVCTLPVPLGTAEAPPVPLWVQAYRLPPAQANTARRRCRQQHSQKGHQPKKRTRWLAAWVLVVTTLPPTLLPGPMAVAVYRVRWPIEVAMKRWKSMLDGNLLRASDESPLAEVWWHGTFLDVLILDRRLRRTLGEP
jgi:DDE family transposase